LLSLLSRRKKPKSLPLPTDESVETGLALAEAKETYMAAKKAHYGAGEYGKSKHHGKYGKFHGDKKPSAKCSIFMLLFLGLGSFVIRYRWLLAERVSKKK